MSREYRRFFLQTVIYTSLACIVFLLGSEARKELFRTDGFLSSDNRSLSQHQHPSLFDRLAALQLSTASVPSKLIHLGTDPMLVLTPRPTLQSDVGMCTAMHGKYAERYQTAFDSHVKHSEIHGYPIYVLDRPIIDGLWSKEAALLEVLLHEMSKPDVARLRWLMWFDADTLVTNPFIPAETFLPPFDLDDVHLLATEDWNGLNNGVFLMRVSAWSIKLLSNILAYPSYRPDETLPFTEQSAMERWVQDPLFAHGCVYVPPRWFNSYPRGEDQEWSKYQVGKGDMMMHFAGVSGRCEAIRAWHDRIVEEADEWEIPVTKSGLPEEASSFWLDVRMQRENHF
ncbi:hypothetical protein WHR41_09466 [Cladosporium halotolerans]|uniref:Glycosyltransferase family 34 protein n=1 Tax=Cladosporium halotolerans TaxID=1052096 RepID=A0AB34KA48_9PEZI